MGRLLLRASLWLLLPFAVLLAVEMLMVGLFFAAPVLFTWERPFAVTLWAAEVLFPFFIAYALATTRQGSSNLAGVGELTPNNRLYALTAVAWLFVAFWVFVLWWQPHTYGGPWGW